MPPRDASANVYAERIANSERNSECYAERTDKLGAHQSARARAARRPSSSSLDKPENLILADASRRPDTLRNASARNAQTNSERVTARARAAAAADRPSSSSLDTAQRLRTKSTMACRRRV